MKSKVLIQVDCDGKYALSSHYGEQIKDDEDDVFYSSINNILSILKKFGLKATFFVVGKDLETFEKVEVLKEVVKNEHEIANHTYNHPNDLSKMSQQDIQNEILQTNDIIYSKLGIKAKGFRAPNFDISEKILNVLEQNEMIYDCSLINTPWKSLLRVFKGENMLTSNYLGRMTHIPPTVNINEIQISTFPFLKFPCNLSYLLALPAKISYRLFRVLYKYHLKTETPLIFIVHLSDFVDNIYLYKTESRYFKSLPKRLFFIERIFEIFAKSFDSVTTTEYIIN